MENAQFLSPSLSHEKRKNAFLSLPMHGRPSPFLPHTHEEGIPTMPFWPSAQGNGAWTKVPSNVQNSLTNTDRLGKGLAMSLSTDFLQTSLPGLLTLSNKIWRLNPDNLLL